MSLAAKARPQPRPATPRHNQFAAYSRSLPDWFLTEWQNLLGQGHDLNTGLLTPVAGLMPDQEAASWLTNAALQEFMNRQQHSGL